MDLRRRTCLFSLVLTFSTVDLFVQGQEVAPLNQRIDEAIASAHVGSLADEANDYEFLRRVFLNLVGRSPSVKETRTFVANVDPSKRADTVDQLLGSTEFDDYFTDVLDVMLMERRSGKRIAQSEWQSFLHKAIQEKWPFDQIVQTILSADGVGELRGAAKFLLERDVEPNALTRDVSRIFLGRDLQCAQCHDHPNIVDYEQAEYYGILAFVSRSYLFEQDTEDKAVKIAFVGEKAVGETEFSSVFSPEDSSHMDPQLLSGLTLEVEPRFEGEEAYIVAPSKTAAGLPKFSRRAQLARLITHPANEHFAKNVVNRFWAHMMGHGLVDPVDFHHGDNLPSHPALLKILANEFVNLGFDSRELLRQIALSRTYQQSVDFSAEVSVANGEVDSRMEALNSSVTRMETDTEDLAFEEFAKRLELRREKVTTVDLAITDAAKRLEELKQEKATLGKAQAELQKTQKTKQSQLALVESAATAAKKVADSFPEDTTLAEKHKDYQQRADQLTKELEAIQAQLTEKKSLAEKAASQAESKNLRLARLRADRIGLADMVAEARGAMLEVYSRQQQRKAQLSEQQQQLLALTRHKKYLAQLQSQQQLTNRSTELADAFEATAAERDTLTQSIVNLEGMIAAQSVTMTTLAQESKLAIEALTKRQAAIDSLKEVVEKARSAAEQLADPELDASVTSLDTKYLALNEQLSSDKQLADQKDKELVSAQTTLKEHEAERAELATKQKPFLESEKQLAKALTARDKAVAETELAHQQLHDSWERRFAVRALVPLTPEQLAGNTIIALELELRYKLEAGAEWQSKYKDKKPEEIDEEKKTAEINDLLQKRIDQVTKTYISMFAAPGGSPQDVFSATADQALFFANDGRVQSWFSPAEGSLLKRLESIGDEKMLAEELHMAILSRPATDIEKKEVEAYLSERKEDRSTAIREVAWGLLTSLEFRFNR